MTRAGVGGHAPHTWVRERAPYGRTHMEDVTLHMLFSKIVPKLKVSPYSQSHLCTKGSPIGTKSQIKH